ncbi:MAG: hypothetical protein HRT45_05565 [Bdellovibrionales bacterium]|nr:hypothetical protein [Bdellovibrionales bacterium]
MFNHLVVFLTFHLLLSLTTFSEVAVSSFEPIIANVASFKCERKPVLTSCGGGGTIYQHANVKREKEGCWYIDSEGKPYSEEKFDRCHNQSEQGLVHMMRRSFLVKRLGAYSSTRLASFDYPLSTVGLIYQAMA